MTIQKWLIFLGPTCCRCLSNAQAIDSSAASVRSTGKHKRRHWRQCVPAR